MFIDNVNRKTTLYNKKFFLEYLGEIQNEERNDEDQKLINKETLL